MKRFLITLYDNNINSIKSHVYACEGISGACIFAVELCYNSRTCLLSIKKIPDGITDAELSAYCKLEKKRVKEVLKMAIEREG